MTEQQRELIAAAGRWCELELGMADIYERNGNLAEAAHHYGRAEYESEYAFEVAVR